MATKQRPPGAERGGAYLRARRHGGGANWDARRSRRRCRGPARLRRARLQSGAPAASRRTVQLNNLLLPGDGEDKG